MAYDLLIRDGLIVDGTGQPPVAGNVAVQDGRIVAVGETDGSARRVIDADGLAVSPGFIDHHTHMDAQIWWDPLATSCPMHGVTSIVHGNCGLTLHPCRSRDRQALASTLSRVEAISLAALQTAVPWEWETTADYLAALAARPLGVNVGSLVGHCALGHCRSRGREGPGRGARERERPCDEPLPTRPHADDRPGRRRPRTRIPGRRTSTGTTRRPRCTAVLRPPLRRPEPLSHRTRRRWRRACFRIR